MKPGKSESLGIKLSSSVARRVVGHTAKLSIKVTATTGGRTTAITTHLRLAV